MKLSRAALRPSSGQGSARRWLLVGTAPPMGWLILSLLMLGPALSFAAAIDKLKDFVRTTHAGKAQFSQTVLDKGRKPVQSASGVFQFVRPGKFRWSYDRPYEQLIVGDGAKLWVYDKELNQVVVKKLDQAIGSSPAALLSGDNEIEKNFKLSELGNQEGLEWLEATPKSREGSFERLRLGFNVQSSLAAMELRDAFGQTTVLKFSGLERNPSLSPELFKFSPPLGADVMSD